LDLDALGLRVHDLAELGDMFTKGEVWATIKQLPPDRAPEPDGFVGAFLQGTWPNKNSRT
jgi:hypothetical protein